MAALSLGGRETMGKFGKAGDLRQKGQDAVLQTEVLQQSHAANGLYFIIPLFSVLSMNL
jgi:hypothetical protein